MQRFIAATPLALAGGISLWLLASCASDSKPAAPSEPVHASAVAHVAVVASPDEDSDEPTGKSLYTRHCAGCHNDNGDGRGATMLQQSKQARSFAQGGFAFGNTPEAVFKTITSGIPGSSLMPSFKGLMDDDERMLVAKYVLTLTPYKVESKASDSVMVVGDRAVFAYGKLPAIHDGLPERPRGLMVGLPGGLSFEYRTDEVRLLAVRRGAFVDRTDWNERGGGVLNPLGEAFFVPEAPEGMPTLLAANGTAGFAPIQLELIAARTLGPHSNEVQLESKPSTAGSGIQSLVETVFQPSLSERECFGRRFVIQRTGTPREAMLTVIQWGEHSDNSNLRSPNSALPAKPGFRFPDDGWNVISRDGGFECVQVLINKSSGAKPSGNAQFLAVGWSTSGFEPVEVRVVSVRVKTWDEALLARWTKELAQ